MHNILLVTAAQGYIPMSVKEKFEEDLNYKVLVSEARVDSINKIKEDFSAILFYVDENVISQQTCIFLKDKAVEQDIPIFILGNMEDISVIESVFPAHLVRQKFLRPIDVKEVFKAVDEFISNFGKHIKKKILVVDDSGAMLRNVKSWLEESYQIILANSGAMAIKYLAMNRPDLVLLDYEMPVVDGRQVLEMIRTETEFADIPVIFLTSKGDRESVMKVMELKPEGYLLKTMKPADIIQAINEFFEKQKIKL
ncbi:MAG: response regulator [Lachnospiraceae bacterium]|nr:response regulator [Lachnospiraceae bacterium]